MQLRFSKNMNISPGKFHSVSYCIIRIFPEQVKSNFIQFFTMILKVYIKKRKQPTFCRGIDSKIIAQKKFLFQFKFRSILLCLTSRPSLANVDKPIVRWQLLTLLPPGTLKGTFLWITALLCCVPRHSLSSFTEDESDRSCNPIFGAPVRITEMAMLWRLLLLSVAITCCLSQGDSPDYFQPGKATEDCICVPLYLCEGGEIVTDGSNVIDPRRRPDGDAEELPLDEKYAPPECGPFHVCCRNPESSTVTPYDHKCGNRNPGGINGRILTPNADGEAQFGEWPWQAAILKTLGDEFVFKCGGTLIDDRHIITVAHCVDKFMDNKHSLIVRLGEWDTQNVDEFMPHEDYGVQDIFIHSQYRPNNLHNDIAVVRLNQTVKFKPHIDTACLPQDDDDFTGQKCVATGWGTNAYQQGEFSLIMKEITLPVISNEECQALLRKTRLGPRFKLHSGFLCAGGEAGQDACRGDGGGPLVCFRSDNSYTVAGLVSWGIDCGGEGVPGVYTNVKKFIDFIISKTQKPIEEYWSS